MNWARWIATTSLIWCIVVGLCLWRSPSQWAAGGEPSPDRNPKLVAAIPPDFPPTYFREPKAGKASGLAVDVMNELARSCGFEVEYRFAQGWEEIEGMLISGRADLIPFRVINEGTRQRFIFTRTLDASPVNFVGRASHDANVQTAPGMKVGVIGGSTAHEKLSGRQDLTLVPFESMQHLLMDLLTGQLDRILAPRDNVLKLAAEAGLMAKVQVIEPPAFEILRAIALRRGEEAMRDRLDLAIQSFRGSEKQKRIYEYWLSKPEPWWTVQRVLWMSGGFSTLVLLILVGWRFLGMHRLNRRIQAERAFLQTMMDAIPDLIFFKDRNSAYLGCNEVFARNFIGLPKDRIVGRTDQDIIADLALAGLPSRSDRAIRESAEPHKNDEWMTLADGNRVLMETVEVPFRDESGTVGGIIGISRDVTERKRAEEDLRESQATLQGFYDSSPFMMGVSRLVGERIVAVSGNAALARFLGTTPEEIPGRTIEELWQSDEVDELWLEHHRRCLEEKRPTQFQFKSVRSSRWLEATIACIGEGRSGASRFSFIVEDITERKSSLETLKDSLVRLDSIVDFLPDATFVIDRDGKVIAWNKAVEEMTGVGKDQMIGRGDHEYAIPFYGERRSILIDLVLLPMPDGPVYDRIKREGDRIFGEVYVPQTYGGRGAYLWGTASILRDGSGTVIGAIESVRDITERKQMEEERIRMEQRLQQVQKAESLGRMAGAIAHNFNNMLAVAMGNLELALEDVEQGSTLETCVREAMSASRRAAEVSRFMLTYLGHTTTKAELIDVVRSVREACELLFGSIPKHVRLKAEGSSAIPRIQADKAHLTQILTNLIINAVEAMGESDGEVVLSAQVVAAPDVRDAKLFPLNWEPKAIQYACISVADTGCGMAPEMLDMVFDPFFSTKFAGRGMGLSVALGLVRAFEGAIGVDSRPGGGATFRVFLPLPEPCDADSGVEVLPDTYRVGGAGLVLVVDDEAMVRAMAEAMLRRKMGCEVVTACNGMEALDIFSERKDEIGLVILDLSMPGMNGWQTLSALRALRCDIPVILTSGYDEAVMLRGECAESPQAFLRKPYSTRDLQTAFVEAFGASSENLPCSAGGALN